MKGCETMGLFEIIYQIGNNVDVAHVISYSKTDAMNHVAAMLNEAYDRNSTPEDYKMKWHLIAISKKNIENVILCTDRKMLEKPEYRKMLGI